MLTDEVRYQSDHLIVLYFRILYQIFLLRVNSPKKLRPPQIQIRERACNIIQYFNKAYLNGVKRQSHVFVELNRHYKSNILSPTMIQEIHRFLDSYDLDDGIQYIWWSSHPEIFSKGTDLKYISQLTSRQDVWHYLREVQRFAIYMGQYHKILHPIVQGEVSGSMASILAAQPFTLCKGQAQFRWNESNKGFIPHAGGSYILSRLPHELGLYLALTGDKLNQDELQKLGLIYGEINDFENILELYFRNQFKQNYTSEQYLADNVQYQQKREKGEEAAFQNMAKEFEIRKIQEDPNLVISELMYKYKLLIHENAIKPLERKQLISNPYLDYQNKYLSVVEDTNAISRLIDATLQIDTALISRCFGTSTLEDILERLRAEKSQLAERILKNLESKSPTVLKIIIKLIREAEKLNWRDCLNLEYNVMGNLGVHSEFKKQMNSEKSVERIQNIDSFFEKVPLEFEEQKYACLPVKQYFDKYSENILKFLNEGNLRKDLNNRLEQMSDVEIFLTNHQLPQDYSIPVTQIRKIMNSVHYKQDLLNVRINKLKSIVSDTNNLRNYIEKRINYVKNADLSKLIEQSIEQCFEQQYHKRLQAYQDIAAIQTYKDKNYFFSLIRNLILNKQLTEEKLVDIESWEKAMQRLLVMPDHDQSFLAPRVIEYVKDRQFDYLTEIEKKDKWLNEHYSLRYGDPLDQVGKEIERYGKTLLNYQDKNVQSYLKNKERKDVLSLLRNHEVQFNIAFQAQGDNKQEVETEIRQFIEGFEQYSPKIEDSSLKIQQYLYSKQELREMLNVFYDDPNNNSYGPIQKQLSNILESIYRKRQNDLVKLNQLGHLDNQINKSLELDQFELVENNLIFTFAYSVILFVERIYELLQQKTDYNALNRQFQLQINDENVQQLTNYLNQTLTAAALLYDMYRDKLISSSDRVLDAFIQADNNQFRRDIILNGRALNLERQRQITFDEFQRGSLVEFQSNDEILRAVEDDITIVEQQEYMEQRKRYQQIHQPAAYGAYEQRVYNNLIKKWRLESQHQRDLMPGIHRYLQRIDLITVKQYEATPPEIQKKNQELDKLLDEFKWFEDEPLG
ncbi:hypothetical protein pb186bvf_012206 [Paramecium bursaria]